MISLIASLILATHTGDSQVDYVLDCMSVDMPYELKKGMRWDVVPLYSALHCTCMLDTSQAVGVMSAGPLPDWMLVDVNKLCRKKTNELLKPKPQKKKQPAPCEAS